MALSKLGEQLAAVPLFSGQTQRQLNRIAQVSQETAYRTADVLLRQGTWARS